MIIYKWHFINNQMDGPLDNCNPKLSFLVFSDDWGEHPSSCQHLFRYISQKYQVLWVNTVGMRSIRYTPADIRKAINKIRKMIFHKSINSCMNNKPPNLYVCQPPMIPLPNSYFARAFNCKSVVRSVRKKLRELRMNFPIFVTTVPNACYFIGYFNERIVVYYCVDDFSEWPGLEKITVRDMEADLIKKSGLFIATSGKLFNRLAETGKPTYLLTHGVDLEHFTQNLVSHHPILENIPEPRIGYFGLFDERSDQDLLFQVAKTLPHISFVITGPVEIETSKLSVLPNVFFTGQVGYKDLPSVVAGWRACILPYVQNKLTEAINPLKIKEYLAAGKPVISTPLPEAKKLEPYVKCCSGLSEWCIAITSAIEQRCEQFPEKVLALLAHEKWENKAIEFLKIIVRNIKD